MIEPLAILWALAVADDPTEIARLEAKTGSRQADAVEHIIEHSDWCEDLPHLVGGRGTPEERRLELRAVWEMQERQFL